MGRKVKRRVWARRWRAFKDGASTDFEVREMDSSEDLCTEEGGPIRIDFEAGGLSGEKKVI